MICFGAKGDFSASRPSPSQWAHWGTCPEGEAFPLRRGLPQSARGADSLVSDAEGGLLEEFGKMHRIATPAGRAYFAMTLLFGAVVGPLRRCTTAPWRGRSFAGGGRL